LINYTIDYTRVQSIAVALMHKITHMTIKRERLHVSPEFMMYLFPTLYIFGEKMGFVSQNGLDRFAFISS